MRSVVLLLAALFVSAEPARAAFPGDNGRIGFTRSNDLWTAGPDGADPAWSVDDTIAFESTRDGNQELWAVDADGSDVRALTSTRCASAVRAELSDGRRLLLVTRKRSLRVPDFGRRDTARVTVAGSRATVVGRAAGKWLKRR